METIDLIGSNPFYFKLKTHSVNSPSNGICYSSSVNGDIRIVWREIGNKDILLLALGGHSGKHKVYN